MASRTLSRDRLLFHIETDPVWIAAVTLACATVPRCEYGGAFSCCKEFVCPSSNTPATVLFLGSDNTTSLDTFILMGAGNAGVKTVLLVSSECEAVLTRIHYGKVHGAMFQREFSAGELTRTFERIESGEPYRSLQITAALRRLHACPSATYKILSNRELALLPDFGRGDKDAEIAAMTAISPFTVKRHRHNILKKLGLKDTKKLMRWAAENGFVHFKM